MDSIIGRRRSVVIRPLKGMWRLSSSATPKPTTTWPTTETITYFAVMAKFDQMNGSLSSSR